MIPPGTLARFQDEFARALLSHDGSSSPAMTALIMQPAFAVYRNTVMKACIDSLQANYPTVARLVGEEWLRAAAAIYVRESLPTLPMLLNYGTDFPDFLTHFEPAADLPYLSGVAQLDRYWTEAHSATSEDRLDAITIKYIAAEVFFHSRLQPHSAARWGWFSDAPVYTIWSRNRNNAVFDGDIDWQPEGALLTRPRDAVTWQPLNQNACLFLDACASGGTLADAIQSALEVDSSTDIGRLIADLIEAGAFSRLDTAPCLTKKE